MTQSKRGKKRVAREFSSESLMFRSVAGIILIALGVLALLPMVAGLRGAAFDMVRGIMQGLGGGLCFGIPVFLIWGGVLVSFSARRSMPVRGILLLFLFYLCVLAIINLLSKVGQASFMDYLVQANKNQQPPVGEPASFWNIMKASYSVCVANGTFGGALGMLFAWVLWTFVGTMAGTVVLVILCLICAMFFSKFDLIGWGRELRGRSDEKMEERELRRQQQEYEKQLALQQEQAASKPEPAYLRRGKQNAPMSPNPADFGIMPQMSAMQGDVPALFPMNMDMQQGSVAPMSFAPGYQPPPAQPPQLYDELIATPSGEKPAWRLGGSSKKKAKPSELGTKLPGPIQTEMTFTPSEIGVREPMDRVSKKAAERIEEIRKRKAELAQSINANAPSLSVEVMPKVEITQSETYAPERTQPPEKDKYAMYKRPAQDVTADRQSPMSGKRLDLPELKLPDTQKAKEALKEKKKAQAYAYPTLELLNNQQQRHPDTRQQDTENAARLEKTLESFGIPARVQRVTHGPAVTRFELGLISSGINVKRITSIADNIALEMAANGGVRIEVPIPGTNLFGIEVPNKEIMNVTLAEVLISEEMCMAKSPLAVALGRDIAGKPIICDLAKMPHLLIAGQTGSGKSVCINTIINSILFRSSPEQVRMIMIDPKVVELQCYNVVPHLLIPVVSDPHKAAGALAWAVAEMLDRYHKMQSKNVRELTAYNAKLGPDEEKLPRIVIVIDELADLMLACKKEVEESIIRIAQLARAAGIHMIVATQRPTVDVITGLIKANVPSRIAFAVSSSIDSRTILDGNGAEKLLGKGDMFYSPTGSSTPLRVQGCFLSDGEIERVVDYIAQNNAHEEFDPNILEALEAQSDPVTGLDDMGDGGVDDKLQEAIEMVIADGQASISMLQRRMKIGYARAGRLIDDMAARGIVSKSAGSKPREVLISREEFEQMSDSF